jgi:hypothetical protein
VGGRGVEEDEEEEEENEAGAMRGAEKNNLLLSVEFVHIGRF